MPNKNQNIRIAQKRKLRHLTLIKTNKLRNLNYKNSILENTWLGQVNKDFSVYIQKDNNLNELEQHFENKRKELMQNIQINFTKNETLKKALIDDLTNYTQTKNNKKENIILKEIPISKENDDDLLNQYININTNDLNTDLKDDSSSCIIS